MPEITNIQLGNQYNDVIRLDDYNGEISVVACNEGKSGKFYPKWVYPQTKDGKPGDKRLPMKVGLGSGQEAARRLRYLADCLEAYLKDHGAAPAPDYPQGGGPISDDIPF